MGIQAMERIILGRRMGMGRGRRMGRVSIALSGGRGVLLGRDLGLRLFALIFVCFCLLEFLFDVAEG